MNFFFRNKEPSDPAIIVKSCLKFLLNRITDDLEKDEYNWDKPWGVKRFESIILAKFMLNQAFERIVENQLSNDEKNGYYDLSHTLFCNTFNEEFSEIGMNYLDMKEEIEKKVKAYSISWEEEHPVPECYYQIHMLTTGSPSREKLAQEVKKKTGGLEFMRRNIHFSSMVTEYEAQISHLEQKIAAFDFAATMLPHMFRSARQKVKNININKIKSLSKKLAKKDSRK